MRRDASILCAMKTTSQLSVEISRDQIKGMHKHKI